MTIELTTLFLLEGIEASIFHQLRQPLVNNFIPPLQFISFFWPNEPGKNIKPTPKKRSLQR